jgi:DNA-binding response OmpR family regulator
LLGGAKILVAEDDPLIALDLAAAVAEADGQVIGPVATVSEGLEILAKEDLHAAILDVKLLDGEVTPVAQALLEKDVVVLLHTGSDVPAGISGHAAVCKKPTTPEHIIRTLEGALRQRQAG